MVIARTAMMTTTMISRLLKGTAHGGTVDKDSMMVAGTMATVMAVMVVTSCHVTSAQRRPLAAAFSLYPKMGFLLLL
eukprot:6350920-Pyramimonas_sp.AAC.1